MTTTVSDHYRCATQWPITKRRIHFFFFLSLSEFHTMRKLRGGIVFIFSRFHDLCLAGTCIRIRNIFINNNIAALLEILAFHNEEY